MPETEPVLGAPAPPSSPRERVTAIADAIGTTPTRLVLGAAVGVVLAAAVVWTLLATPSTGSAPEARDEALPRASATSSTVASPPAARSLVYVTGAVVAPGVYRLGEDARVADAIAAAGGPAPDADLSLLNLAAPVADGERVYVPRRGEPPPSDVVVAGSGASVGARAGPVNLNTATAEQLEALPGIGPSTAQAILAWRRQHGRFRSVDDLLNVRGIGRAKLDALRDQVRV